MELGQANFLRRDRWRAPATHDFGKPWTCTSHGIDQSGVLPGITPFTLVEHDAMAEVFA